ncbi:unnamed protein product [Rangifer tarandus platyrhynchus]|uniref:Uncharacterized protein n=2 Tax=Rangifer tarandus platyrhynchus TaxID=3082113 RepID=A0AC59YRE2_RANTA|nr:unnamed protein product [Rangifer tarandus platyrhynchus]
MVKVVKLPLKITLNLVCSNMETKSVTAPLKEFCKEEEVMYEETFAGTHHENDQAWEEGLWRKTSVLEGTGESQNCQRASVKCERRPPRSAVKSRSQGSVVQPHLILCGV